MQVSEVQALGLTNYGHFTSMRTERGGVRGLDLHMRRLSDDCRALFGADLDIDHVRHVCRSKAAEIDVAVMRVTVFDPGLNISHPAGSGVIPEVLVTARAAASLPADAIRVQPVVHTREAPHTKHVGLFDTVYLRRNAQLAGYDDVLFMDTEQHIYEGGTWNIGFVADDQVVWPDGPWLPGVTMRLLRRDIDDRVELVGLEDLSRMDAAFASNANVGARVISAIGGADFPTQHRVIDKLRAAYHAHPLEQL